MNIAKLCHHGVATVFASDEVTTAAEFMRKRHVGYLVVIDVHEGASRPIGVLTDRDIVVSVVARQIDPATLRVGEIMTQNPVVASDTDSLDTAIATMRRIGVRRLPVVGGRGQLIGVLSMDEVLRAVAGQLTDLSDAIRNERQVENVMRV
jgi:CBS domain-containing protein